MNTETAQKNMRNAAEQVFRLVDFGTAERKNVTNNVTKITKMKITEKCYKSRKN